MPPVVHPLDDVPEQKLYQPGMGRMRLTRPVFAALTLLQVYLGVMALLLVFRAIVLM
jgi:hypothetical protein